jgi:hypothetical protein
MRQVALAALSLSGSLGADILHERGVSRKFVRIPGEWRIHSGPYLSRSQAHSVAETMSCDICPLCGETPHLAGQTSRDAIFADSSSISADMCPRPQAFRVRAEANCSAWGWLQRWLARRRQSVAGRAPCGTALHRLSAPAC